MAKDTKAKRIMVTGAGGALARQVINRLGKHRRIVAVDFRRRPSFGADVPCYRVDLHKRGFEDVFREHTIAGVVHLGRIEADESTPERRYNANVLGTQRLFDLCVKYGVGQVLVLSSFYVYGASPYNPALLTEDAPLKASGLTAELVDSVELENLANIYMWKERALNMTILRPCHIAGPKIRNSMSLLLSRAVAPALVGFSPMMQFIHVEDMAEAVVRAYEGNRPGLYNVAPDDYVAYGDALKACGCRALPLPSVPQALPRLISQALHWDAFPAYLVPYLKYPVIVDGSLFERSFEFVPRRSLADIFDYYRRKKQR